MNFILKGIDKMDNVKIISKVPVNNAEMVLFVGRLAKKTVVFNNISIDVKAVLDDILANQGYLSDEGQIETIFIPVKNNNVVKVILVGLGEIGKLTLDKTRALAGDVVREAKKAKMKQPCMLLPLEFINKNHEYIQAFVEGLYLGSYEFEQYKSKKSTTLEFAKEISLVISDTKVATIVKNITKTGTIIGQNVNFARDLINQPGNVVTPQFLAHKAADLAKQVGLTCSVLKEKELEKLGMRALLGVAQGSSKGPRFVVLEHNGQTESKEKIAFVGKGVTFDSGGISIKPSEGMGEMKDDMGGAAAVMATMVAIAQLALPINVVGVLPCVENMPSGKAIRPGDIIKAASGKTIEVITTDAEGRMILADAVWYADTQLKANMIIDIATLTGAASIALGDFVTGIVSNNQRLCDRVLKASQISGERCWQMPGDDDFKEYNKSDVADLKNSGGRSGGMITGGLFIGEFTNKPWVHIDIGNTVANKTTKGYKVKGANGTGVRLLVEVAKAMV